MNRRHGALHTACGALLLGCVMWLLPAPDPLHARAARTGKSHRAQTSEVSTGPSYRHHAHAMAWADDIAARHELPRLWVRQLVGQARMNRKVQQLVTPAPRSFQKNWHAYRNRFIEPTRIRAGVDFWQQHATWLNKAEAEYGVPAWLVTGIIGVETIYGRDTGRFAVLDALATLSFDFPQAHPRAEQRRLFFREELEQFILLASRGDIQPKTVRGSYAGAMGWPQFMPGSWARHAVDFDADGRIDLFGSPADIIGSVARYFRDHGWQSGQPALFEMSLSDEQTPQDKSDVLAPDIVPSFSAASLASKGVRLEAAARDYPGLLAVVELGNADAAPSYLAGTQNFYVITRYNWSAYYAAAVIELGRAVAQARTTAAEKPE